MVRRDILKDEIERLGQVLGAILLKLIGKDLNPEESINYTKDQFSEKLDLDFEGLTSLGDDDLLDVLLNQQNLTSENLDLVARIFQNLGEKTKSKELLRKALVLLTYLHENDTTYSLERQSQIDSLNQSIQM